MARNFDHLVTIAKDLKKDFDGRQKSFHVTFALKGSKIVHIGINNYKKGNAVSASYKKTRGADKNSHYAAGIHSEMAVCGKLKHTDTHSSYTLVNVRIDNNNNLANSCPCSNCAYQLGKLDFKKIFYSTDSGEFKKLP